MITRTPIPRRFCGLLLAAAAVVLALPACAVVRDVEREPPVFDENVQPIVAQRCDGCHAGVGAEGGWRSTSFLEAIYCLPSTGASAVAPGDDTAPILAVLDRADLSVDHRDLLDPAEREILEEWVRQGAPDRSGRMHPQGFSDPRAGAFHGTVLRGERWLRMLDSETEGACGRCHEGAPVRPEGVSGGARDATPCTDCHSRPGGPVACNTCHGHGNVAYPPRDLCFFPETLAAGGWHLSHVRPGGEFNRDGIACSTCHAEPPTPESILADLSAGDHGDDAEVRFDLAVAGDEATWDQGTKSCVVACHSRGGARATVHWDDTDEIQCGDCHAIPPADHYAGACTRCHAEPNATGSTLADGPLHLNGRVDLGDGTVAADGRPVCWACHGTSETELWPTDTARFPNAGQHAAHLTTRLTDATRLDCPACHVTPADALDSGHLDMTNGAEVVFGTLAASRGAMPLYDPATHTCEQVYCHGQGVRGATGATPDWDDGSGLAGRCGACHAVPPPPPHTTLPTCQSLICHGGEISPSPTGPRISFGGRGAHIDGVTSVGGAT